MFEYRNDVIEKLKETPFESQGSVGDVPDMWAKDMELEYDFDLPKKVLEREEVRIYCQEPKIPILMSYLIVMAWGGQGRGPGGKKYAKNAWNSMQKYQNLDKLEVLRNGCLSRSRAYELFCDSGKVPGLGPAYFTKLLHFFSPDSNMYIMDQWTMKSVILLCGKNIIRHSQDGLSDENTGENYELYCRIIDDLVKVIGARDGNEVEQRLFSVGSIIRRPRGEFRQYVVDQWKQKPNLGRYDEKKVQSLLTSIDRIR